MKRMSNYQRLSEMRTAKRRLVLEMIKAEIPLTEIMSGMSLGPLNILWILLESVRQRDVALRSMEQLETADYLLDLPHRATDPAYKGADLLSERLIEELNDPENSILRLATDGERVVMLASRRLMPSPELEEGYATPDDMIIESTRRYAHLHLPVDPQK